MLAGGLFCGYAFLKEDEPASPAHLAIQDEITTLPAEQNLRLVTGVRVQEARLDEIQSPLQQATSNSAFDLALALQKELMRAACFQGTSGRQLEPAFQERHEGIS